MARVPRASSAVYEGCSPLLANDCCTEWKFRVPLVSAWAVAQSILVWRCGGFVVCEETIVRSVDNGTRGWRYAGVVLIEISKAILLKHM